MDPFSITAGTIGITSTALSGMSTLRQTVTGWKNAPQEVKDVTSSLKIMQDTLTSLEDLKISDLALSTRIKTDLEQTAITESVNNCGDACKKFAKDLAKWTARSTESQMSTRDRFSVGIWHRAKVERFKTQVESCQSSLVFAITSAQLLVQLHLGERSEVAQEDLQKQLQALETQVSKHSQLAEQLRSDVEGQIQRLEDDRPVTDVDEVERAAAVAELRKQSRVLEDLQASCGVISLQTRSTRTRQTIRDIITDNKSQAFIGMPKSVVGKIEQLIEGVKTTNGSTAYVGVFDDKTNLPSFGVRAQYSMQAVAHEY